MIPLRCPHLRARAAFFGASAALVWLAACGPAAGGDAEYWTPLQGAGGAPANGPAVVSVSASAGGGAATSSTSTATAGGGDVTSSASGVGGSGGGEPSTTASTGSGPVGPADGSLSVDFTTVTFNGKYAPDNVVAAWITDDQGVFIKTLGVWATKRVKYLVTWLGASKGNAVDAITGATFGEHGAREVTWDSTDVSGKVVPDGTYRIHLEFTEQNKLGKVTSVEFVKGPAPVDFSPPDQANFKSIRVIYQP